MLTVLKNIYGLFKMLFKSEEIRWDTLKKIINNQCKISAESLIVGPCVLTNVTIDKGTYVAENSNISLTKIGKFCSIGPNFICGWGIHPLNGLSTSPVFYSTKKQTGFTYSNFDKFEERKPIIIKNDVFIGANVTILDGVVINDGAVIGAGAVVTKDVPEYAIVAGVPASIIKYRFNQDVVRNLLEIKWWDGNEDDLKQVEKLFNNVDEYITMRNNGKIVN